MFRTITLGSTISLLALVAASTAQAQTATPSDLGATVPSANSDQTLGDIVVTAQKRAEDVRDVPLSVIALSGETLQKSGVTNVLQLQQVVPSLKIDTVGQSAGVILQVRGFGSGANAAVDSDVATYVDGVYIPRPGAILSTFLDIQNVEVLRGPQGTLSGRNATVGAISLVTNTPTFDRVSGAASIDYSSFNTFKGTLVANVPVSDTFALRGAGLLSTTDGYIHNLFDGKTYGASKTGAGRLSAKWEITPSVTWLGRFDYARVTGDGVNLQEIDAVGAPSAQLQTFITRVTAAGGTVFTGGPNPYTTNVRYTNSALQDRQYGLSSELGFTTPGDVQLRLIDSYRNWNNRQSDGDNFGTTLDIYHRPIATFDSNSQSHELQILSPKDKWLDGRLSLVGGLYFFVENYRLGNQIALGSQFCALLTGAAARPACIAGPQDVASNLQFDQRDRSLAGYVQADFKIIPSVTATFGFRETRDRKTGNFLSQVFNPGAAALGASESTTGLYTATTRPTYRGNLTWRPRDGLLAYASYSTGFKSGGFNTAASTPALNATTRTFAPEMSENYEVGVKATLFHHTLQVNADAYIMNIENFQQRAFNGVTFVVGNAGNIRSQGFEFDMTARVTRNFTVGFSGDYLNSYYTSFHNAGGLPGCSAAVVNSCVGYEVIVGGNPTIQDLTGQPNGIAPKWQGNTFVELSSGQFAGGYTLGFRASASYLSKLTFQNFSTQEYGLVNLNLVLASPGGRWSLTGYAQNVTDARYFSFKYGQPLANAFGGTSTVTGASLNRGYIGAPRVLGVRLGVKY